MKEILMGTLPRQFADGNYQSVTFSVTEDCNLRCKYCYMTGKNEFKKLDLETAKKIVDFVLSLEPQTNAVAWEFIGGEPTLEMELIDKIADYAKLRMFELNHVWFNNYIFNIGTNGILYDSPEVQEFIRKNASHVTIGITIDGTKQKHDLQRVTKDGKGSYDQVVRNIPLWLEQIPGSSTKVTFASEDLCFLKDSIVHLWAMGLMNIPANVVFEDVWKEGDDLLFENQLYELADYILNNNFSEDHSVRFFDQALGFPLGEMRKAQNYCGSGKILAFDCDGRIYPCVRFYEICQNGETICVGDVDHGFDSEKKKLLSKTCIGIVNDGDCTDCSIASGCFACAGNNYRYTYPHSIYKRTKYNCKMHKANVRANEYFWDRWTDIYKVPSPHELARKQIYQSENWKLDGAKYLFFVTSEEPIQYCCFSPNSRTTSMTQKCFDVGVHFAYDNYMIPVYLGNPNMYFDNYSRNKLHIRIDRYSETLRAINEVEIIIPILDEFNYHQVNEILDACILIVNTASLCLLQNMYDHLSKYCANIRIIAQEYWKWSEQEIDYYVTVQNSMRGDELNESVLTRRNDCKAGISEYAYCPDQKIYPCPAYYYHRLDPIGDINSGISSDFASLVALNRSPDCTNCKSVYCQRCSFVNTLRHGMPNIPAEIQCKINLQNSNNFE